MPIITRSAANWDALAKELEEQHSSLRYPGLDDYKTVNWGVLDVNGQYARSILTTDPNFCFTSIGSFDSQEFTKFGVYAFYSDEKLFTFKIFPGVNSQFRDGSRILWIEHAGNPDAHNGPSNELLRAGISQTYSRRRDWDSFIEDVLHHTHHPRMNDRPVFPLPVHLGTTRCGLDTKTQAITYLKCHKSIYFSSIWVCAGWMVSNAKLHTGDYSLYRRDHFILVEVVKYPDDYSKVVVSFLKGCASPTTGDEMMRPPTDAEVREVIAEDWLKTLDVDEIIDGELDRHGSSLLSRTH